MEKADIHVPGVLLCEAFDLDLGKLVGESGRRYYYSRRCREPIDIFVVSFVKEGVVGQGRLFVGLHRGVSGRVELRDVVKEGEHYDQGAANLVYVAERCT
jgi:hypothetical protein